MHAWSVVAIVLAVLLIAPLVSAVYGTLAKTRWGINLRPVSCPRDGTRIPVRREPRSLQQALWRSWTCPVCGIEVDKWGREIAPVGPGPIDRMALCEVKTQAAKWSIVMTTPVLFCLALLENLVLLGREPFPLTLRLALTLVIPAMLEVLIICLMVYFCVRFFVVKYYSRKSKGLDSAHANESGRTPEAGSHGHGPL
jgi:hypothetical protein